MTFTDSLSNARHSPNSIIPAAGDHHGDDTGTRLEIQILVTVLFVLIGWGMSIATWGVPGLYIPAVALVPVMFVLLVWISRG